MVDMNHEAVEFEIDRLQNCCQSYRDEIERLQKTIDKQDNVILNVLMQLNHVCLLPKLAASLVSFRLETDSVVGPKETVFPWQDVGNTKDKYKVTIFDDGLRVHDECKELSDTNTVTGCNPCDWTDPDALGFVMCRKCERRVKHPR